MGKTKKEKKYTLYGGIKLDVIGSKDELTPKESLTITLPDADKKALALAVKENLSCLLIGETGTGKTSAVKHLAHLIQQPYVRVNMTGFTTPDELVGSKSVRNGETYFEHGIITDAMKRGAILVIDEINATTPDCLFILHGLLDEDRRITLPNGEVIHPHPNFRVFATCNPDYEGTRSMNKAFLDRFPVIIAVDTLKPQDEKALIIARTGIDEKLADKFVTIATMNRKNYLENKTSVFTSTRSLLHVAKLIKSGLSEEAAYFSSIVRKTSVPEEQAVLKDSYYAVFKIAGSGTTADTPTIITVGEMEKLQKEAERGRTAEFTMKRIEMERALERNAYETKISMMKMGVSQESANEIAQRQSAMAEAINVELVGTAYRGTPIMSMGKIAPMPPLVSGTPITVTVGNGGSGATNPITGTLKVKVAPTKIKPTKLPKIPF